MPGNAHLKLLETAAGPVPAAVAAVTAAEQIRVVRALPPRPVAPLARIGKKLGGALANVLPPLVVLALMLVVWEIACASPKAALPAPTRIWQEAHDLISQPFFVSGPQDIGLGWRVLTSLQRVAVGFSLAAVVGILLGALVGQSQWAMRGLDPIFQVLRTVPPLACLPISLAAFRDANPSAIFVIFITAV
jgi:nitrate/nitrite transport system permease protein